MIYWAANHLLASSRVPGLADRVFTVHTGSGGFDSHRRHMFEQFFRSNRSGYLHPVFSELESSGIRVAPHDISLNMTIVEYDISTNRTLQRMRQMVLKTSKDIWSSKWECLPASHITIYRKVC